MRDIIILLACCLSFNCYASKSEKVREWSLSEVVSESDLIVIAEMTDYYLIDEKGIINRDPEHIAFMSTSSAMLVTRFCIREVIYGQYKNDCFNIEGALFLGVYMKNLAKYQSRDLLVFIKKGNAGLKLTTISGAIRDYVDLNELLKLLVIKKRDTVK